MECKRFKLDPEILNMPKITFSNQVQKPFWEEITKDILTPFAPKKSISLLKYAYEKSFLYFYILS